jgi:chemotaxis protein methyltransferase CheR
MNEWTAVTERLAHDYGLAHRPDWPELLEATAAALAREWRVPAAAVPARILADPALLRMLAGKLTIDESHFFRHPEHFAILKRQVAPRLREGHGVAIWSAGCSRGEEP